MSASTQLEKSGDVKEERAVHGRSRLLWLGWMLVVIAAGILWRSRLLHLLSFFAKYGGDALWALMVFLGFGLLMPRRSTLYLVVVALTFSFAVEFSQLYHEAWIDRIRATRLGALALGSVFNWADLLAYMVGVGIGAVAERLFRRGR